MNGYYAKVIEQLKAHGYRFHRQAAGSHEIWTNGQRMQALSRNMKSRDMANAIMKQADIDHRF